MHRADRTMRQEVPRHMSYKNWRFFKIKPADNIVTDVILRSLLLPLFQLLFLISSCCENETFSDLKHVHAGVRSHI